MSKYIFRMYYQVTESGKTYTARVAAESLAEANDKVQRALGLTPLHGLGCSGFTEIGAEPQPTKEIEG